MSDGISNPRNPRTVFEVTIDRPKATAIELAASRGLNQVFTAFATHRGAARRDQSRRGRSASSLPGWT